MPILRIEIHHYHHYPELASMTQIVDDILAKVSEQTGKLNSLIALTDGLADAIEASIGDPEKLQQIADGLRDQKQATQDAIDRNDGDPNTPPTEPPATP